MKTALEIYSRVYLEIDSQKEAVYGVYKFDIKGFRDGRLLLHISVLDWYSVFAPPTSS
jgi:hypothetical protein